MNRHILRLQGKSDRERAELYYFRNSHPDRKCEHVAALVRIPIDEQVRRSSHAPSVGQKIRSEVLQIKLTSGVGAWTSGRPPLLREDSYYELFSQVAKYSTGSELPF